MRANVGFAANMFKHGFQRCLTRVYSLTFSSDKPFSCAMEVDRFPVLLPLPLGPRTLGTSKHRGRI